jgi:hypothetical protein
MRFFDTKAKKLLVDLNLIGVTLIPLTSLLLFAYLGTFIRYISDDYFSVASLHEYGYWGAQAYWWGNWSGRYSFIALILFVDLFGLRVIPVLPALFQTLWILSVSLAVYQLLPQNSFARRVFLSFSLASVITWISLRSLVQYPEVVFWKTGICNYAISPILFSFFFRLLYRRLQKATPVRILEIILSLVLALVAGGFSETGVAVQITLLAGGIYFLALKNKPTQKNALLLLIPALIGSILALVIMSLSPGNLARAGDLDNVFQIPDIAPRFFISLEQALLFIPKWFVERTTLAGLAFLFGMLICLVCSSSNPTITLRKIASRYFEISIFVFLGVWSALAPSFIIRGYAPPERAMLIAFFLVTCLVIFWGWLAATILHLLFIKTNTYLLQLTMIGLVYIALFFGPIATINANLKLLPTLRTYSILWDERDQVIRDAVNRGEKILTVTNFQKHKDLQGLDNSSLWIVGDLEEDPDYWINQGAAKYYGLDKLSTK